MLTKVQIKNFKSIRDLEIDLGRVNVFIGENGSGKSNILEGLAFAAAASNNKLDNEFLASRGVRVPYDKRLMLPGFQHQDHPVWAEMVLETDEPQVFTLMVRHADSGQSGEWATETMSTVMSQKSGLPIGRVSFNLLPFPQERLKEVLADDATSGIPNDLLEQINFLTAINSKLVRLAEQASDEQSAIPQNTVAPIDESARPRPSADLTLFLAYEPTARDLRTFSEEGQILPLGIHGEGLFRLLKNLAAPEHAEEFKLLKEKMHLIGWFDDFEIPADAAPYERRIRIRGRYLNPDLAEFDQRCANEGFLFLLFYFCLFISKATPPFFAVDNIDASLNPRLCERMMSELIGLAKLRSKQAILTTHNPAILDGLNLNDPEQRLYSVFRNRDGETRVERIGPPEKVGSRPSVRLSEAYLRGYLGGLPTNF